jgi:hypothetical protein
MKEPPQSADELRKLSKSERDSRTRALTALRLARKDGRSIDWAVRQVGSSVKEARHWARDAVRRRSRGAWYPTRSDRIWRVRPLYVDGDLDYVDVDGSDEAVLADRIFDTQYRFIVGDATPRELEQYRGVQFGGRTVETDPYVLEAIANRGDADPAERYRELFP